MTAATAACGTLRKGLEAWHLNLASYSCLLTPGPPASRNPATNHRSTHYPTAGAGDREMGD